MKLTAALIFLVFVLPGRPTVCFPLRQRGSGRRSLTNPSPLDHTSRISIDIGRRNQLKDIRPGPLGRSRTHTVRRVEQRKVLKVDHSPKAGLLDLRPDTLLKPEQHLGLGGCPVDEYQLSQMPFPCPHAFDHACSQCLGDLTSYSTQVLPVRGMLTRSCVSRHRQTLLEGPETFLKSGLHDGKYAFEQGSSIEGARVAFWMAAARTDDKRGLLGT
ncbi:hypothetical protein [Streptomyces flaveolus]|uniref:hypothetical protein n=1 Tax=Streptomyces flaveolus TaxID=67297 RepID=UPI00381983C6